MKQNPEGIQKLSIRFASRPDVREGFFPSRDRGLEDKENDGRLDQNQLHRPLDQCKPQGDARVPEPDPTGLSTPAFWGGANIPELSRSFRHYRIPDSMMS